MTYDEMLDGIDAGRIDGRERHERCAAIKAELALLRELAEKARLQALSSEGVLSMAVDRLEGTVEGRPTHRGNFLQRIDELRRIERRSQAPEPERPTAVGPDLETPDLETLAHMAAMIFSDTLGEPAKATGEDIRAAWIKTIDSVLKFTERRQDPPAPAAMAMHTDGYGPDGDVAVHVVLLADGSDDARADYESSEGGMRTYRVGSWRWADQPRRPAGEGSGS